MARTRSRSCRAVTAARAAAPPGGRAAAQTRSAPAPGRAVSARGARTPAVRARRGAPAEPLRDGACARCARRACLRHRPPLVPPRPPRPSRRASPTSRLRAAAAAHRRRRGSRTRSRRRSPRARRRQAARAHAGRRCAGVGCRRDPDASAAAPASCPPQVPRLVARALPAALRRAPERAPRARAPCPRASRCRRPAGDPRRATDAVRGRSYQGGGAPPADPHVSLRVRSARASARSVRHPARRVWHRGSRS